jgi:hypothetical protein
MLSRKSAVIKNERGFIKKGEINNPPPHNSFFLST